MAKKTTIDDIMLESGVVGVAGGDLAIPTHIMEKLLEHHSDQATFRLEKDYISLVRDLVNADVRERGVGTTEHINVARGALSRFLVENGIVEGSATAQLTVEEIQSALEGALDKKFGPVREGR